MINTRQDLDTIQGTPAHSAFMNMLAGSIYRLEKDDVNKTWVAVEDTSTITRFGFSRNDFNINPPELPVYAIPTPQEQLKAIEQAITKHMDEVAQAKRYDNRDSCRLYAGYVNPFQAEAIAFGQWVSACWVTSNEAQALIMQGLMQIPTPEEAVASLPNHPWYVAPVVEPAPVEPPIVPVEPPP